MKRPSLTFFLVISTICLTACLASPGISETTSPTILQDTPSRTVVPTVTSTPTITPVLPPSGAGFVTPSFEVQFLTHLEDLPPDEYLILRLKEDATLSARTYRYISLDGKYSGDLFSISGSLLSQLGGASGFGPILDFGWQSDNNSSGIIIIDLQKRQVNQFNPGCGESFWTSVPSLLSPSGFHFAYSCTGNGSRVWYVVSVDNRSINSYSFPPTLNYYEWYRFEWISDDLALVWDGFRPASSTNVCLLQLSKDSINCLDQIPYWIEPTSLVSPDGNWVVSRYVDSSRSNKLVTGLLSTDCFLNPQADCLPTSIPGFVIDYSYLWENAYWSPDGSKLAAFNIYCEAMSIAIYETKLWTYTPATQKSRLFGDYVGECYDPGPGPWTSDGKHLLVIDSDPSDDWRVWLVSTDNGSLQRIAGNYKNIIDVVSLFQVP